MAIRDKIPKATLLTRTDIRIEFGWSPELLNRFLPKPSKVIPVRNTNICFYNRDEIVEIADSDDFKNAQKTHGAVSIHEYIDIAIRDLHITKLRDSELISRTVKTKNQWRYKQAIQRGKYWYFDANCVDDKTLNRWVVNYIRHSLTSYDDVVSNIPNEYMSEYERYHNAVLDKIVKAYPSFAEECKNQKIIKDAVI